MIENFLYNQIEIFNTRKVNLIIVFNLIRITGKNASQPDEIIAEVIVIYQELYKTINFRYVKKYPFTIILN